MYAIDDVAAHLAVGGHDAPSSRAVTLAGMLRDVARALAWALERLTERAALFEQIERIAELHKEGSREVRAAFVELLAAGTDPLSVLRAKDLYERLEAALDRCADAGRVLGGVAVKHG